MRFWFSGPRFMGIRPGISVSPNDFRAKTRQKPAGTQIEGNFVYVVRGDHNLVKIGVTQNPRARLAQLKTGSAFPLDYAFIGAPSGDGYTIESAAMQMLDRQRINGEWFDVSPEMAISAVMGAAGKLGQKLAIVPDVETADKVLRIASGQDNPSSFGFVGWLAVFCRTILYTIMAAIGLVFWSAAGAPVPDWLAFGTPFIALAAAYFDTKWKRRHRTT